MQTKRGSLFEASLNTASGFVISYAAGLFIFPAFGLPISPSQNLGVVSAYTILSVVRSYVWRRLFNHYLHHKPLPRHRPF
jgi:uncharacterized paraquat-inducible protein A